MSQARREFLGVVAAAALVGRSGGREVGRKVPDPSDFLTSRPKGSFAGADKPPLPEQDVSIEGFLRNGGIVLACGFAFGFMVSHEAKRQEKKASEVRSEVPAQVIPGIIVQPSGFFALLEAQRNGCGSFPAEGAA